MPAKSKVRPPTARKRPGTPARAAAAPLCVVGIGASAGGFEPIQQLIDAMPSDSGLAFVVIQHLMPTHKSFAADLLGRHTAMKVVEAADGMRVEANRVYTAPSDKSLSIVGGALHLAPLAQAHGLRLPIDGFFGSLAEDQREKAVGIILSGTGADGTRGAKAISGHGGVVLAQRPETAQFDGMPRSAIGTGVVSQVLSVLEMPDALLAYARHPYTTGEAPEDAAREESQALGAVLALIRARMGFDFSGYKHGTLVRRVRRRMALVQMVQMAEYLALLERSPAELDALFRDFFVGVTEFFRDPQAWEALRRDVIVPLVAGHEGDTPVRAWVPGCSTGEEAYTLAMLLLATFRDAGKAPRVQVFATDVNDVALQVARAGVYPQSAVAHVPAQLRSQYLADGTEPGHCRVTPELRRAVTFSPHNVFADPPFTRLDIVSCRNLLIYLEPPLQDRILSIFRFALEPRGCLFLGSAESVGKLGRLFGNVARKWHIFRARGTLSRPDVPLPARGGSVGRAPARASEQPAMRGIDAANIARDMILELYSPAAVLVNGSLEVLYYSGRTEDFLARPRGAPTSNLLLMVREGLRSHVREAVRKARSTRRRVAVDNARVKRGSRYVPVRITAAPASGSPQADALLLVAFEVLPPPAKALTPRGRESAEVRALGDELRATQRDLQTTIEDLEASNQELTSAHQEMLSSNEELQSINEELESSKEELQSLNEELSTVNHQLQNKVAELEAAHGNLNNVIVSSEIATLWLDRDLRIKWSTPAMEREFHVLATDAGRPVSDLGPPLTDAGLIEEAKAVLKRLEPLEHEQSTADGRHFARRIVPFHSTTGRLEGVIVTLFDMTSSWRNAREALEARKARASALEDEVRERTRQLRELAFALTQAEENERRNLAQNLHDDLAQVLSVVQIKLTEVGKGGVDAGAKATLKEIGAMLSRVSRTVQSLAFQLSPSVLYELGLMPAIEWLAEEMRRLYGLQVAVHDDGHRKDLDDQARITVYRAVRELLINVAKHARVNVAEVRGRCERGFVLVEVADGGAGFDTGAAGERQDGGGFGLVNVRERLELIGGSVTITSLPGDGTTVTLAVPLPKAGRPRGKKVRA